MANFEGYLFKKTVTQGTSVIDVPFPNRYIALDTWSSTPNQREEIKAYRDDNTRDLTRVTAQGKKSKFSFKTRKKLHLNEKKEIQQFFTDGEQQTGGDPNQRKIQLTFWNDESNSYKTGYFYRPNMEFKIYKITDDDIIYDEMSFELIEY